MDDLPRVCPPGHCSRSWTILQSEKLAAKASLTQAWSDFTKVVAISLLDRDGLRPSCELRRASKPVRFPLPLKERIQDCEFPDVYQIIRCSLYKLREVEQNVKSEVKTKHSDDK